MFIDMGWSKIFMYRYHINNYIIILIILIMNKYMKVLTGVGARHEPASVLFPPEWNHAYCIEGNLEVFPHLPKLNPQISFTICQILTFQNCLLCGIQLHLDWLVILKMLHVPFCFFSMLHSLPPPLFFMFISDECSTWEWSVQSVQVYWFSYYITLPWKWPWVCIYS